MGGPGLSLMIPQGLPIQLAVSATEGGGAELDPPKRSGKLQSGKKLRVNQTSEDFQAVPDALAGPPHSMKFPSVESFC